MIWAFCINSLIFGNNIAKGGLHYEEDQSIFDDIYGCVLCICMCYLAFSANEKKDNLKEVRSQITTTAEKNRPKQSRRLRQRTV